MMNFRILGYNDKNSPKCLFNEGDPDAYYIKLYENGDAYVHRVKTNTDTFLSKHYTTWANQCLNNNKWVVMWTGSSTPPDRKKAIKPPAPTPNYVYRIQKIEVDEQGRMFDPPVKSITIHPKSNTNIDLITPLYKLINDKE